METQKVGRKTTRKSKKNSKYSRLFQPLFGAKRSIEIWAHGHLSNRDLKTCVEKKSPTVDGMRHQPLPLVYRRGIKLKLTKSLQIHLKFEA